MSIGKTIRLGRLFNSISGKSMIIPMDHGVTSGPIEGVKDINRALLYASTDPSVVQGVVLHRGVVAQSWPVAQDAPSPALVLHLSAATSQSQDSTQKVLVASVEEALSLGADAVSIHVNLGVATENQMLRDFGAVAEQCHRWGMPLLAMMYARENGKVTNAANYVKHSARVAAEMGADFVKVNYPGSDQAMAEVAEGCFIPVLIAGGEHNSSDSAVLDMAAAAMKGGAAGVCIGRNVFQNDNPGLFIQELARIVHGAVAEPVSLSQERISVKHAISA